MTQPENLAQWLDYIQQLHPSQIDMGLDRLRQVATRLNIGKPAPVVITVTGTNGKGSHVATLDAVFRALGYKTGSYTSPHLIHYNERVCLHGMPVKDQALTDAFSQIEQARGAISLSYFEFGTLAALMIFQQAALDIVILEVGLGGRLDAVNLIDADVAVISSIGLDHQEWLGNTRESVAFEKAGIFRAGKPVVCTDAQPPENLLTIARQLDCPVYMRTRDFDFVQQPESWQWHGSSGQRQPGIVTMTGLPLPELQLENVSGALQAALLSGLIPNPEKLAGVLPHVLHNLHLAGRQQWAQRPHGMLLLDVSHNPQAAQSLARTIAAWRHNTVAGARVRIVLAMMQDKDHAGYYKALEKQGDFWYIAHFDLPRCMASEELAQRLRQCSPGTVPAIRAYASVSDAYRAACSDVVAGDLIVVCGSFITVSDVMQLIESDMQQNNGI